MKWLVVFCILSMPVVVFGATCEVSPDIFYVDFVGGNDSNNGTSDSTPWQHAPGDSDGSWHDSQCTLQAGDVVIFKGGVQYDGGIEVDWSGSGVEDANRIIYDGDSGTYATRWGAGSDRAIIDGGGESNPFQFTGNRSYITINNFELRDADEVASSFQNGCVNSYDRTSTYIDVGNNIVHDCGYLVDEDSTRGGVGINNQGGSYWSVHDNLVYDAYRTGIANHNGDYNKVYNNTITGHIIWGVAFQNNKASPNHMTGNEYYNNTMYDLNRYIELGGFHGNQLWIFSTSTGAINNMWVYNNLFYNSFERPEGYENKNSGFIHQQVGLGGSPSGGAEWDGYYVFNNVMFNQHAGTSGINMSCFAFNTYDSTMANVHIYNNTFYSDYGSFLGIAGNTTNVYVKNNVAQTTDALMQYYQEECTFGDVEIDYNNWDSSRQSSYYFKSLNCETSDVTYKTWAEWQTAGYDTHGNGPTSDPLFNNVTIGSFNLSVQADSPCKDDGTDLSGVFSDDIVGTHRPQGSVWDIGAYEFLIGTMIDSDASGTTTQNTGNGGTLTFAAP